MRVEFSSNEVKSRTVRSSKDGKEYTFYNQEGWFHDGFSQYPSRCFVPVPDARSGYDPGWYRLAPGAVVVDRFGNLTLRRRFDLLSDVGED